MTPKKIIQTRWGNRVQCSQPGCDVFIKPEQTYCRKHRRQHEHEAMKLSKMRVRQADAERKQAERRNVSLENVPDYQGEE